MQKSNTVSLTISKMLKKPFAFYIEIFNCVFGSEKGELKNLKITTLKKKNLKTSRMCPMFPNT